MDEGSNSKASISVSGLGSLTLVHSLPTEETDIGPQLEIEPGRPAVIGRANDPAQVPYLAEGYSATQMVPGSEETVIGYGDRDNFVSRGHFMLQAAAGGVVLVNGVPKLGGGIRPPRNWTRLIAPEDRLMEPGEEYFIGRGFAVKISLPNGAQVAIRAG